MKTKKQIARAEYNRRYSHSVFGLQGRIYNKMVARKGELSFTLDQFRTWVDTQPRFVRLYREWEQSNYNAQLKPVVDRIDCHKGYEYRNMHFLTLAENIYKHRMENVRNQSKTCYRYSNGKFIDSFPSVIKAAKTLGLNKKAIGNALRGQAKTSGGFQWSYEKLNLKQ